MPTVGGEQFYMRPHYRSDRPLDATMAKVRPTLDRFPGEIYADQIASILTKWRGVLVRSPHEVREIGESFAADFAGSSTRPTQSRVMRSDSWLQVRQNSFSGSGNLNRDTFLHEFESSIAEFGAIEIAELQITSIDLSPSTSGLPVSIETEIRYEIVGTGNEFHREQRVGTWSLTWRATGPGEFRVKRWRTLDETVARASSLVYSDIASSALGGNPSYSDQLMRGTDYWRTVLDGACGIDIYGHNGISVADVDNDGFDDLYVCQPAGLPNRLYRNRGDGTFEDITEPSGLGFLDSTTCALFADFNNDGLQDVILVRNNGPVLFLNDGHGKFRPETDAFRFANPPQGTFTGAAVADYDRDGWLDIYFCLYAYYQGTGQYRYPLPYHDAENGPPNFLMRNNRDGTFSDVTTQSKLSQNNTRYSFCCGWNDFNGDGWPDLYVVNDFGRKNLYRNNGDGTFTDVAANSGVEDVGAGMSVSWIDYNNDGAEDLYVANMWTAAGVRVAGQDAFKQESSPEIRTLFRKHAMGNSLFENHGEKFENQTLTAGSGVGRWAWSSDAFDFDHDGYPDLYVTNGMVSGSQRYDLNSFFWRQVVANSPDEAVASHIYEQGWNAVNELLRADHTWSGYERNVFYANNRDGTFSDVSAAAGLDFSEDGRSFALADFDHDGRLEIFLKNRNAPQLRLLKNRLPDLPASIAFRLKGTKSNRDAIGAVIAIETSAGPRVASVQAGSGFLSQHSKDVFFGIGDSKGPVRASIHWPSGLVQEVHDLPINHRIWIEEGSEPLRVEPFRTAKAVPAPAQSSRETEVLPDKAETWLLAPVVAPDFTLPELSGRDRSLSSFRGKIVLLNFWDSRSSGSIEDLRLFQKRSGLWANQGMQLIVAVCGEVEAKTLSGFKNSGGVILRAFDDFAAIYNILYRQLFDRHRDMPLPTTFLIDATGNLVKVYQGPVDPEHVEHDFRNIPRTGTERLRRGLPFSIAGQTLDVGRNYLSLGSLFFQRGYLDQAGEWFQQALGDDPSSAEALYGIGSVYLNENKNADARKMFERCVELKANYPDTLPDAWNNLGVLATRESRVADSISNFQQALKLSPRHLLTLDNLGNAYRLQKRWDDARKVLTLALEVAPDDPEANYSLGMVFAQTEDTQNAYEHLQRALKARPVYPEALNNLGVLYLVTKRRDEAVASFEQCIRVAPAFDQAYLNLARVYALEGAKEKAKAVLADLLKQRPDHPQAKQMLEQLP